MIGFVFQIVGLFATVFLVSLVAALGVRLGWGKPLSPTELERRKDLGRPF